MCGINNQIDNNFKNTKRYAGKHNLNAGIFKNKIFSITRHYIRLVNLNKLVIFLLTSPSLLIRRFYAVSIQSQI